MLSMVSPLFFCPSKWVLCASKRRMHQSSLTFQTTSRADTTGPWSKVAVKLVSFPRGGRCVEHPWRCGLTTYTLATRVPHNLRLLILRSTRRRGRKQSRQFLAGSRRVHSARCVSFASFHSHTEWRRQCVAPPLQSGSYAFSRHCHLPLHSTIAGHGTHHPQSTFTCHTHCWCSVGSGVCFQQFGVFSVHCPSG